MKKSISLCLLFSICCLQLVKSLPTNTTQAPNSAASSLFKNKNIPSYDAVCETIVYTCKRKLPFGPDLLTGTTADTSRPCVKYCIKYVLCDNGHKVRGKPNECVELNEDVVREEFQKYKSEHLKEIESIMPVAMIDFPCQPGFLPDGRGKCREAF